MITATTIAGLHLTKGVGIELTSIWSSLFLNMKKKRRRREKKFWKRRKNIIDKEGNVIMEMEEENIIARR